MEPAYRLSRRKFLQAAMVAAAAATGTGLACSGVRSPWRFLTVDEARTLAAICDQIIPPDEAPGATWAAAVNYVDRQLCGPLRHLRNTYRQGIAAVDESSRMLYGATFAGLAETKQVELLSMMEQGRAPERRMESRFLRKNSLRCWLITLCRVSMATLATAATAREQAGRCWALPTRRFAAGSTTT